MDTVTITLTKEQVQCLDTILGQINQPKIEEIHHMISERVECDWYGEFFDDSIILARQNVAKMSTKSFCKNYKYIRKIFQTSM